MSNKSESPGRIGWLDHRAAGVLLHPTCLPGDFGIGNLGPPSRRFIDFLEKAGMRYWQVCPLGPTGYGDSPYQSTSSFAGNPYLIDPLDLCEAGLIPSEQLGPLLFLPHDHVDYGALYRMFWPILREAFEAFRERPDCLPYGDYGSFKKKHSFWLDPYASYQALKEKFHEEPWNRWPPKFRSWKRVLEGKLPDDVVANAETHRFFQYVFFGQWKRLRRYARDRGIQIVGDIPIFVAPDSADIWGAPELFQVDSKTLKPTHLAGVPPDYFSKDGQFWGNPLYDWDALESGKYDWWMKRLAASFQLYDVVRIDHFRGFEAYWSIPAGARTAREGAWVKGPGLKFFKVVREKFPDARIVAEDLGTLSPEVFDLLEATGLPGMAVLQFAFGGPSDNLYLPHNHKQNTVIYSGTHDNDTTLGWYRTAGDEVCDHVRRYLRISGDEIPWDFIRTAYRSVCRLAIFPLQDLMSLDSGARFNTPGTPQGNWQWRFEPRHLDRLQKNSAAYLCELAELYGR